MIGKRFVTSFLALSVFSSTFLFIFTPRAEAFIPVVDVPVRIKNALDYFAVGVAKTMVNEMVKSSIAWANNGFNGGPAYVTDPKRYFAQTANGAAGDFIRGTELGFLCSPFQTQIRLSLQRLQTQPYNPVCTITGIVGNLDNYYNHFSEGGWDGWFAMTQNNSNNPYGAYLDAEGVMSQRVQSVLDIANKKLDWNSGFKSKGDCIATNHWPPSNLLIQYENGEISNYPAPYNNPKYFNEAYPDGSCLEYGPDKTPGSIIKDQLDKVLPSGLEKLISAQHVEELVGAFANGLLNRYVFGSKGLFSGSYNDHYGSGDTPPTVPTPVFTQETTPGWTSCASESQFCSFSGTKLVHFGSTDIFTSPIELTDGTECTVAVFGDPYAVLTGGTNFSSANSGDRWCEYQDIASTTPATHSGGGTSSSTPPTKTNSGSNGGTGTEQITPI